jgi:hypothetical protein
MHSCTLHIMCSHRVQNQCLVRGMSMTSADDFGTAMALAWPHDNERWRRRSGGIASANGAQIMPIGWALAAA